jgi:PAS domain-containing protein
MNAVVLQHDITESKRIHETVEQIFERGGTPMVMVWTPFFSAGEHVAGMLQVDVKVTAVAHPRVVGAALLGQFLRHASLQINEQGIIQKYNESAAQTFGYSKEEAIGQNIKMLMSPDVADKHDGYLRRYVETGVKHIVGRKRGLCLLQDDEAGAKMAQGARTTNFDIELINWRQRNLILLCH